MRIRKKRPWVGNQNLWGSSFDGKNKIKMLFTFAEANCYYYFLQLLSHVWCFVTPWTVAYQAPLSMGFSRQEYWCGLPFPSPGNIPDPGIEPWSPALQADALLSEPPGCPYKRLWPSEMGKMDEKTKARVTRLNLSKATRACHYLQRAVSQFQKLWREISVCS